ncbi:MAG: 3-hydroxyacyl-CoA dehydrogenase NAD-binding domain-containing protein, partial [Gemmatimonadaceae bacterium]
MTAHALNGDTVVGVVGAGAMGTGIAQVALKHGHRVLLTDSQLSAVRNGRQVIEKALQRDVDKGRLTAPAATSALERLETVEPQDGLAALRACGIVIEAIVEHLDIKQATFRALEKIVTPECVLATNTSSLSIASIGAACEQPERVLGVHFFNPATIMPLVEVVPGLRTDGALADAVLRFIGHWGKTAVRAADTPGFIVNRIARP